MTSIVPVIPTMGAGGVNKRLRRPHGWPSQSPYGRDDAIIKSQKSVGRKVKTCPMNSGGTTTFRPEWYHGEV